MQPEIIGLDTWWDTPPGQHLLAWEQARFDEAVVDVFGFNAIQLGVPELAALRANRMPHRWLSLTHTEAATHAGGVGAQACALVTDPAALPFPDNSVDLLVLPHTLELSADPHTALREVARVLRPEGRVVLSGFNPVSLWGLRQHRAHLCAQLGVTWGGSAQLYLPRAGDFIGHWRMRDWLRLLSFEVEATRLGVYQPAVRTERWLQRFGWLEPLGRRWWPIFGAVYFLVAVKRVQGTRLLGPAWKPYRSVATARPANAAGRSGPTWRATRADIQPNTTEKDTGF
ncbi:MAG: methyltransferase domain-containing protein [Burkholderiaceae bacterium]